MKICKVKNKEMRKIMEMYLKRIKNDEKETQLM